MEKLSSNRLQGGACTWVGQLEIKNESEAFEETGNTFPLVEGF